MRAVRVNFPLAIMLGLTGSTSAFLQNVRPTHFVVPAHKYQAAIRGIRAQPRATARHMRTVASAVETSTLGSDDAAPEAAVMPTPEDDTIPPVSDEVEEATEVDNDVELESIPLNEIAINEEYEGIVQNVVSYGAFVDIGAEVNGLVHISQMADEFVANCDDHVKEGDTVRVRVLNVEPSDRKLVLSMRSKTRPNSSDQGNVAMFADMLREDPSRFMTAKVENIVSYGAFFSLEDNCTGFVHISQLSPDGSHVNDVNDILSIGQEASVRIRDVDVGLGRINLSLLPYGQGEEEHKSSGGSTMKDVSFLAGADPTEFRSGTISAVQDYGLFVNIDGVDGLCHVSKLTEDRSITSENIHSSFNAGQEVQVRIMEVNTMNNKMSLSMCPPVDDSSFMRFGDLSPEEWIEGTVVSLVNYGAFVRLEGGFDGMVHISNIHPQGERIDSVYDQLEVGQKVNVRVIEADMEQRKLRLSMRENGADGPTGGGGGGGQRSRSTQNSVDHFLNLSPEEWIGGTVASITNFGAFVAVDADTDGLLHISQISDDHVDNVEDYLQVGQDVQVRVIDVDVDNARLGLSMREPRQNNNQRSRGSKDVSTLLGNDPDEFITGEVVSIVPYGCFVNIGNNIDGLVHISEMAEGRVDSVEDIVEMGQEIQVRISEVNVDNNTVNLSMIPANNYDDRNDFGF